MKREVIVRLHGSLEELAQNDDRGSEYWLARDVQEMLGYAKWENFEGVVCRAVQLASNGVAKGIFTRCSRQIAIGSGAVRSVADYRLDRDALELFGLLTTSFKLNGFFLARNETVLLGLLKKWVAGRGLSSSYQFRLERYVFDLMIADRVLIEFDEPHHLSSRQLRVDQEKDSAAKRGGFEVVRLNLSHDVVDAILKIESILDGAASQTIPNVELVLQRERLGANAQDFADEITNFNIKRDGLADEPSITHEHVKNNRDVRDLLGQRGIRPEALPATEDIKKVERRVQSETKKLPKPKKRT